MPKALQTVPTGKLFCTIAEATKETGLSQYFIREGVRNGQIPCIKCGNKFMINMRLFLPMLDDMSKGGENNHEQSEEDDNQRS